MGKDRTGASAEPLVIKVPVGTQILSEDKEEVLADFTEQAYLNYSMYVIMDRALPPD